MPQKNTIIKDFRGQEWTFIRVTRQADESHSGKVEVKDEFGRSREFFWTVFPTTNFRD